VYLGEGISKYVTLTSLNLNLGENSIGENGAKYLGVGIAKCATLTSLNLDLGENSIDENYIRILK